MANELVTAKDLQGYYDGLQASPPHVVLMNANAIKFIERIDRAATELAALRAKVTRLSAPVSDVEWDNRHSVSWPDVRKFVNAIIAARAKEQP